MEWIYDSLNQEHRLVYQKSILARMQITPGKKGRYVVSSLIDAIYYGRRIQKYLQEHKKQWVAYKKKFCDKQAATDYMSRKKGEILRFINAREKE